MRHGNKLVNRRFAWFIVPLVVVIAGPIALLQAEPAPPVAREAAMPVAASASAGTATKAVYFHTLPPSAKLPSGAKCARLVSAAPRAEDKAANKLYNKRKDRRVTAKFLASD